MIDPARKIYRIVADGAIRWVTEIDENHWSLIKGNPYGTLQYSGQLIPKAGTALQIPVSPTKIIGVGENFLKSATRSATALPSLFFMPPSALVIGGTAVKIPDIFGSLAIEGELGVVLKTGGRDIPLTSAQDHILGYTVVNDFSGREPRQENISNGLKKGCDGMLPIGPSLLVDSELRDFRIKTWLNGYLCHDANTQEMTHSIPQVISFASKYITLNAGDLICMGAMDPKPIGGRGDTIRIEIAGLDDLETQLS